MSSIGAVVIADNTDKFDYIKLAALSAAKIKTHLNIPVALITTTNIENTAFDKIIKTEQQSFNNTRYLRSGRTAWLNLNRTKVFELSPWDRTLLVDADFFVQTDALKNQLLSNFDFAIAKQLYNPVTGHHYTMKLGKTEIEQLWATVMIFNKCDVAKEIFALAEHVLVHYQYYHKLYNFNFTPLRNDYAFTIAGHLLGGYGQYNWGLQGYNLVNCDFNTKLEQLNDNDILISHANNNKHFIQRIKSDVHIQNKDSLFEKVAQL